MANLKVEIDSNDPTVQIYGKYRYNGNLSSVSKRKHYPDMLSMDRTETCIKEAIKNYHAELDAKITAIRAGVRV